MIMSFFFSNRYYLDSMPRCYDTCVIFETRVVSDEICLDVSHDMLKICLNVSHDTKCFNVSDDN